MTNEHLLKTRAKTKRKKPTFRRQDSHKKHLASGWRKPRGWQSKVRLGRKGYVRKVSPGWGSPRGVRGLTSRGLEIRVIASIKEVASIDPAKTAVVLAATIGAKKRIPLLQELSRRKITILNAKDPQQAIERLTKAFAERAKERDARKKDKKAAEKETAAKKQDDKAKATPAPAATAAPETPTDEKQEEKKELDRLLTKPKNQ